MDLEANSKMIGNRLRNEPVLVMFSTGKDSIVMLDLLMKYHKGRKEFVFLYFVDGLSIKENVIQWYERKYGISIHREPSPETASLNLGKRVKMTHIEAGLRKKYDISYIAQGVRKCESLARRGMLANLEYGIDERNKKLYPIGEWTDKQVWSYIKLNRLAVPAEYEFGYKHDFWIPDGKAMLFLKRNFPDDYRKVLSAYPKLEVMTKREEMYGS